MTFRRRVALLVAAVVAGAFVIAASLLYLATQRTLLSEVDGRLVEVRDRAQRSIDASADPRRPGPRGGRLFQDLFRSAGITQVVDSSGQQLAIFPEGASLPIGNDLVAVAAGAADDGPSTLRTDDGTYRALAFSPAAGLAIRVARPIDEIDAALDAMRVQAGLASLLAVGIAALAGRVVANRVLQPVGRLTETAEVIARTQDLAHRIGLSGTDELARLGAAFDEMLEALQASRRAQHQLVADASHELRTPLTSLRTNVELLADADRLDDRDRAALRADIVGQITELTTLVGNLVELARDGRDDQVTVPVRLDEVVEEAVERQRRLTPGIDIRTDLTETTVLGVPQRLRLAVANLLDNAAKYGADGPVDVEVGAGNVVVRDRGPGIDPADAVHVFDRFWRAPRDRAAAGSGLGLAIVDQVARAHGGSASVEHPAGGGVALRIALPVAAEAGSGDDGASDGHADAGAG